MTTRHWIGAIASLQFAALLATATRYGFHRDELYFIVAGWHPALGYPDQPPLVPLLSAGMHALMPSSPFLLRVPSAVASVATTVLAAVIARECGGRPRAQLIAAVCTAVSGFALAVGHFVTTTTFDLLATTAFLWLMVRAVVRGSGPSLLAAGVVVGLGVEAKPQVAFVAAVVLALLLVAGPRRPLRTWWLAGGVLAAVALGAPYIVWQQLHGWPQLEVAHAVGGSAEGGRIGFIPFQLLLVSPVLVPVWVAGLLTPFRRPGLRSLRFLSYAYVVLGVAYIAGNGKAYYLASLYPALLGVGALPTLEWLRGPARVRLFTAAVAITAVISAFIALPLLPEHSLQGSFVMAVNPDQGETVGWPRFVDTVARAWRGAPRDTAIFTSNYGEAGAIDVIGARRGLPKAYSGHNGFAEWGPPPAADRDALVVAERPPREFVRCRRLATFDNAVGLDNDEQGVRVSICRTSAPWPAIWPSLRHYG
jgi:4-amino-4-deoxy-L-arabinose transferase-like glycosyltransferase